MSGDVVGFGTTVRVRIRSPCGSIPPSKLRRFAGDLDTNLRPKPLVPITPRTRGRIINRYTTPKTVATKKANTPNTMRRLSHITLEDPARSNAELGLRAASTMAQTGTAIAATRTIKIRSVKKKLRIGYEVLLTPRSVPST